MRVMSLVGGWLLAPLVLVALCCGAGLLAERAAGVRLPGMLVPGVGLATVIVVAGIFAIADATAELAAPAVALVALAGFALGRPWSDSRLRAAWPWALGLGAAAFALYAGPSLLSGQGSIAGYEQLDDSAIWLATVDRALEHGRDVAGVPPSSYARTLAVWLGAGYPVGAFLPLGVTGTLSGQDLANAYQPAIAVMAAIAALGMAACVRSLVPSRGWAAAAGLVAVQASLLFGYAHWGGIKEVCVVALLAPAALAGGARRSPPRAARRRRGSALRRARRRRRGVRRAGTAVGAVAALRARPPLAQAIRAGAGLAALLAVVLLPVLTALEFARQITSSAGGLTSQDDLGNLLRPPPLLQGAGLWPVGDLRLDPDPRALAVMLALLTVSGAVVAVVVAARRADWTLPALVAIALAGSGAAIVVGTPWVDAKALAIFAAVPLLAAAALVARQLGAEQPSDRMFGAAGAVLLLAGCAWSTVAVARDVKVAPRERIAELREIGRLTAGRGPLLQLDFDVYGNRWFLRESAPEGATDLRERHVRGFDGNDFPRLETVEIDDVVTQDVWNHRIVVRRRAPLVSRPPAAFRRIWAGDFWEAWERAPEAPQPAARLRSGTAGPAGDADRVRRARPVRADQRRAPAGCGGARAPARRGRARGGPARVDGVRRRAAAGRRRRRARGAPARGWSLARLGARAPARVARAPRRRPLARRSPPRAVAWAPVAALRQRRASRRHP